MFALLYRETAALLDPRFVLPYMIPCTQLLIPGVIVTASWILLSSQPHVGGVLNDPSSSNPSSAMHMGHCWERCGQDGTCSLSERRVVMSFALCWRRRWWPYFATSIPRTWLCDQYGRVDTLDGQAPPFREDYVTRRSILFSSRGACATFTRQPQTDHELFPHLKFLLRTIVSRKPPLKFAHCILLDWICNERYLAHWSPRRHDEERNDIRVPCLLLLEITQLLML